MQSRCSRSLSSHSSALIAAGRVKILHVVLAGRLQVDQHRRLVGELVQPLQIDA